MQLRYLLSVILCTAILVLTAQPVIQSQPALYLSDLPMAASSQFQLSAIQDRLLFEEDSLNRLKGDKTLRFGIPIFIDLDFNDFADWDTLSDGRIAARMTISSPGSKNINVLFSTFLIPETGFFYEYTSDQIQGPYITSHQRPDSTFSTLPVSGEKLILEYNGPPSVLPKITLSYVIHGYRNFKTTLRDFGTSQACNVNVNCPAGIGWENQIKSVVLLMTDNASRFCSGVLIANTNNDGTPYVLTANHCEVASTDMFLFNYESPQCVTSDGPLGDVIGGCTIVASNANSDFCLVELNSPPPLSYFGYLSGWDNRVIAPDSCTAIHHPDSDVKKISKDTDPTDSGLFDAAVSWNIGGYELGTTEPGSSGCPLYNSAKLIVGQLYGGEADCSYNFDDYYGKLSVSWNGKTSNKRLHDWLDPKSTGASMMSGQPYSFEQPAVDLRISQLFTPLDDYCSVESVTPRIRIKNMGLTPIVSAQINYRFGSSEVFSRSWTGTLEVGSSQSVSLPAQLLQPGINQRFTVWVADVLPSDDENALNDTISGLFTVRSGRKYKLELFTDAAPFESSWELLNPSNQIVYSSGTDEYVDSMAYAYTLCLQSGCYKLVMHDSGNDGFCCQTAVQGNYKLLDDSGVLVGEGSQFGSTDTVSFCVQPIGFGEIKANETSFSIWPQPAKDELSVEILTTDLHPSILEIKSITGQTLLTKKVVAGLTALSISGLASGIYFAVLNTTNCRRIIVVK